MSELLGYGGIKRRAFAIRYRPDQKQPDGKKKKKNAVVKLGSIVTLEDLQDHVENTFSIVGSIEADPLNGKLSNNTPLAEAILDHKVGETVTVTRVEEPYKVKILSIK